MTAFVEYIDHLEFTFAPWSWPYAENHRLDIDRFFRRECEINPALWNGRLLLLRNACIVNGAISGNFFETDYASMLAALARGGMEEGVKACFPAAAVLASDGAFIVGEMAGYTRNARQVLFPSGSVEHSDVVGDRVDFVGALRRELSEETGIAPNSLESESGWYAVNLGSRLPLIKIMRSDEPGDTLKQRICMNLAAQSRPEFCEVLVVRDPSDLSDRMPLWVTAFLKHVWQRRRRSE
jgi:8-oxo-dGTP pyrophosphatase MutT (NUDIX family)